MAADKPETAPAPFTIRRIAGDCLTCVDYSNAMHSGVTLDMQEEERRLRALHALDLLDTEPEQEFSAVAWLAAKLLGCPMAYFTLVDRDRQWTKALHGGPRVDVPREAAFCSHTIAGSEPFVVTDATADHRFADNPLVTGDPHIRFYAGMPIRARSEDGGLHNIGAVCGLDSEPRHFTAEQEEALRHLASIAEALIAARGAAREAVRIAATANAQAVELRRAATTFRQAERLAKIGSWRMRLDDGAVEWSEGIFRIHDLPPDGQVRIETALDFYPISARAVVSEALARASEAGQPFDIEVDFVSATGVHRRVRSIGEPEREDGRIISVAGVFQDITEQHRLSDALRRMATMDELTRIANRAAFNRALDGAVEQAKRTQAPLGLMLVDLDDFKLINDTHGHLIGDDVLRTVGRRMRTEWLSDSFVARLGGDEFAVIVTDPKLCDMLETLADRLDGELRRPAHTKAGLVPMSATIGAARLAPEHAAVRDFVHAADNALYAAKRERHGGDRRRARR